MRIKHLTVVGMIGCWVFTALFLFPSQGLSHCDTLDGPVVKAARFALEQGEITPLLKWVRAEDEETIRQAFKKTLIVRSKDAEAKELADQYFFETLIRIHRVSEGMPFTGLKPSEAVDPAVAMADQALDEGKVDALVDSLTKEVAEGLRNRFNQALATKKHADESVEAGRKFVADYVSFTHYTEGLHHFVKAGAGQHAAEPRTTKAYHSKGNEGHH